MRKRVLVWAKIRRGLIKERRLKEKIEAARAADVARRIKKKKNAETLRESKESGSEWLGSSEAEEIRVKKVNKGKGREVFGPFVKDTIRQPDHSGKFLLPLRGDFESVRAERRNNLPGQRGKAADYGFLHGCGCPVVVPCDQCAKRPGSYPCEVIFTDSGPLVRSGCTVCNFRKISTCSFRRDREGTKAKLMSLDNESWGPWSYENSKEADMGEEIRLSESEEGEGEGEGAEVAEILETPAMPKARSKKKANAKWGFATGLERIAEGIEGLERTMRRKMEGIQDMLRKFNEVQKKRLDIESRSFQGDKGFWEGKSKRTIEEVEGAENREEGSSKKRNCTLG